MFDIVNLLHQTEQQKPNLSCYSDEASRIAKQVNNKWL